MLVREAWDFLGTGAQCCMDVGEMPWSPRVMPERCCLSFPRSQNNLDALGCTCLSCWKKLFSSFFLLSL